MSRGAIPNFSDYRGGDCFVFQNKNFYFVKRLGDGSFGEVLCFESEDHATRYAVKCEKKYANHYGCGAYFENEAKWFQVVHGMGVLSGDLKDNTTPHFVLMPYFEGKPLYKKHYISAKQVFYDWIWTAAAIQELHQKHHAIHGDLKSDNVISGEKVYLVDFGLTTKIDFFRKMTFRTADSKTLYHQAPELFTATPTRKKACAAQDIYGLGILLRNLFNLLSCHTLKPASPYIMQCKKVQEIHEKLCDHDPECRWSIAKAIYMLASLFLISVPYSLWEQRSCVLNEKLENDAVPFMKTMNKLILYGAIQIRIDELTKEKNETTRSFIETKIKQKKITGLQELQIKLVSHPIRMRQTIYDAKRDSEITQGIFRHKTQDLLNELALVTTGFQMAH